MPRKKVYRKGRRAGAKQAHRCYSQRLRRFVACKYPASAYHDTDHTRTAGRTPERLAPEGAKRLRGVGRVRGAPRGGGATAIGHSYRGSRHSFRGRTYTQTGYGGKTSFSRSFGRIR